MSEVIAEFEVGSEFKFEATILDYDGQTKIPPDSQLISLYCETDVFYTTDSPTTIATGVYSISYQSTDNVPLGIWYIEWRATKDGKTVVARQKFRVKHGGRR